MSSYASVPSDSLIKLEGLRLSEENELLPLWIEFSFIPHLKEVIKDSKNPLILGCNFMTYVIVTNLLGEKDLTVGCISNGFIKQISELGAKVVNASKIVGGAFDFVVVGVLSPYYIMNILNHLRGVKEVFVYLPPDIPAVVLKLPNTLKRALIQRAELGDVGEGRKALSLVRDDVLKKNVAVTEDLEEVPHLFKYYSRVVWKPTS